MSQACHLGRAAPASGVVSDPAHRASSQAVKRTPGCGAGGASVAPLAGRSGARHGGVSDDRRRRRRAPPVLLAALVLGLGCDSTPPSSPLATTDPIGSPSTVTASAATADGSPDYLWSFESLRLQVDAHSIVQDSSSGSIVLRLAHKNSLPGSTWKIFDAQERCCPQYTFSYIDGFYNSATAIASDKMLDRTDLVLPWRLFGLLGATLPTERQLIVQRLADSGQPSYALFEFVFPAPQ